MSIKKSLNKLILNNPLYSVKLNDILVDETLPKNFHLFDHIDMEKYQKINKTVWWKRMSKIK